ncbi:MAG: hypothetical protein NZ534_01590 [Bacteroidia bacterium]|nr:hypothetical protein [Bacteroidia bacterium]
MYAFTASSSTVSGESFKTGSKKNMALYFDANIRIFFYRVARKKKKLRDKKIFFCESIDIRIFVRNFVA